MRQLLQNLGSGETSLVEVPDPQLRAGYVLIQTRASLVSIGTERMLVDFGRASLLDKARQQPDKVKQVLDKVRTDGLVPTLEAVRNRLDQPQSLGYCNLGVVRETADAHTAGLFRPGDRVVSNGPHAELVCVPRNLCARVPEGVSDEAAAFTVLTSIGLQGVRLAQPTLAERFVVFGLGLIGLLTVQLLRANGCEVLGVDISPERLKLAERFGALAVHGGGETDPVAAAMAWTGGRGVDGVVITASAKTDDIVHQAAQMCRKRGRIVLVGVVGLNLRRSDFYEKELTFQVSCSYGPGRYDEAYEKGGHDYPYGLVRWTEQRNFEAALDLLRTGRLQVNDLITHRVPFSEALSVYAHLGQDRSALGIVLQYPETPAPLARLALPALPARPSAPVGTPVAGVIGAGNFASMTLLPALAKIGARLGGIADPKGVAARHLASKFGAAAAVTDHRQLLEDPAIHAVFIVTGHQLHARLTCEALRAGKHTLVEKPLAVDLAGLRQVLDTWREVAPGGTGAPQLMVGFNRRFSSHVARLRQALVGRSEPLAMNMTVNAGIIPPGHWVHDPQRGGGRIIGEACHFIDLMVFLTGSPVRSVAATMMGRGVAVTEDKMSISLGFEDGSVGTVNYFANGAKAYPKEILEVFSEGRVARMDNFRETTGCGFRGLKRYKTWRQDKGHQAGFAAFLDRVARGGDALIPLDQIVNVTLASFAAMTAAAEQRTILLASEYPEFVPSR